MAPKPSISHTILDLENKILQSLVQTKKLIWGECECLVNGDNVLKGMRIRNLTQLSQVKSTVNFHFPG